MTTVVVGDIGGHYRVFEQVLAQLGVGDDGVLPGGVRVIQVGDMVRFHPDFLRDNGKIVRRLKQILAANSAHHWVQLVGNHESEFLNGGGGFAEKCCISY